MQPYLLDTSVLIDFSKNRQHTKSELFHLIDKKEKIAVCAITIAEFYYGIPQVKQSLWNQFIMDLMYWEISLEAAVKAGNYRYEFARKGITLSTTDSLIASVAWEHKATILTTNIKDFPMKDVKVVSF